MRDRSIDATVGEPVSFIMVFTGAEMAQSQLHYQSPPSTGGSSQTWEPGAHCLQAAQQVGECLFQVPQLL